MNEQRESVINALMQAIRNAAWEGDVVRVSTGAARMIVDVLKGQDWISVKDRLPEVKMSDVNGKIAFSDFVLIHKVREDGTQRMTVDACRVDKAAWMTAIPGEGWTVTHWMPLPEPPEVEG